MHKRLTPLCFLPSYQTPRIPASRSAQSNLTIFTQIPLPDADKMARSTELVTHAEIHRDDIRDSPATSPALQPRSQTGFSNPLFHQTRNNDHREVVGKNEGKNGFRSESHEAVGFPALGGPSPPGSAASPKIPSAPLEDNCQDRSLVARNDTASSAKPCELFLSLV